MLKKDLISESQLTTEDHLGINQEPDSMEAISGPYCTGASSASVGIWPVELDHPSNPANFARDFPGCLYCALPKNTSSSFTSPIPIPDQIGSLFSLISKDSSL